MNATNTNSRNKYLLLQLLLVISVLSLFIISACTPARAPATLEKTTPSAPTESTQPAQPAESTGTVITIANFKFNADRVTVKKGDTVVWKQQDDAIHSIKFSDQESARLAKGETYSRTFTEAGEYTYHCGIHSSMTGVIIVQ